MSRLAIISSIIFLSIYSYGQNWSSIKDAVSPVIELPVEYDSLYRQALSNDGWEDGIHISEDGLNLYCTYVPIDLFSFVLNGDLPNNFTANYLRGAPTFGMDLVSNPIGAREWLHSDILYAQRSTVNDPFSNWYLSDMARHFFSEGAPCPLFAGDGDFVEVMSFTSIDNPTNNTDIWMIKNTRENPAGKGAPASPELNTIYNEDNPHLVRIDSQNLVLFFDSDNLPGGRGDHDIWFAESNNNGDSWSRPSNVSSVNSSNKEHQPFLYKDSFRKCWFLYYSAYHSDGKLAIFRRQQELEQDWNSWGAAELVISAGNTAGIGEPTLTKYGDISFVVVYEDPEMNSVYNHFDADPWFLRKKKADIQE